LRTAHQGGTQVLLGPSPRDGESDPGSYARGAPATAAGSGAAPELSSGGVPSILVIAGPTGTGKSGLAVAVARRLGGEIVGCDALQVYRGLDAATAKPTASERAAVPHWLIDVADPRRDYSVADYVRDASAAIVAILDRGLVPIVAGGSGMYLRGLLKGIVAAPPRDERLRARLRGMIARFGAPRLHRLLATQDPVTAARIPKEDTQRIVRALELALPAGENWSETLDRAGTWALPGERFPALKFFLDLERTALASRLASRVDGFLAAGLALEVERLLDEGVPEGANAFKGIGYREVLAARASVSDPEALREAIVVATRRYAKRQRTWFRKEPGLVPLDAARGIDALADEVTSAWHEASRSGGAVSSC
jgi:tRNA dimethylallyltransferase